MQDEASTPPHRGAALLGMLSTSPLPPGYETPRRGGPGEVPRGSQGGSERGARSSCRGPGVFCCSLRVQLGWREAARGRREEHSSHI